MVDSIGAAVGNDERLLKILFQKFIGKLGRGLHGKMGKKQALRSLPELGIHEQSS